MSNKRFAKEKPRNFNSNNSQNHGWTGAQDTNYSACTLLERSKSLHSKSYAHFLNEVDSEGSLRAIKNAATGQAGVVIFSTQPAMCAAHCCREGGRGGHGCAAAAQRGGMALEGPKWPRLSCLFAVTPNVQKGRRKTGICKSVA